MDNNQKEKVNKLEEKLELVTCTPLEAFLRRPSAENFKKVPKRLQTEELALFAVQNDGYSLKHVSKKLLTETICKAAVKQKGFAIRYVPENILTDEMYTIAVNEDGSLIRFVPNSLLTNEMCELAVRSSVNALEFIPNKMLSDCLIKEAILAHPLSIKHVAYSMLNHDYINMAVRANGLALEYIPKNHINRGLILTAVNNNPCALEFVPIGKRTEEVCNLAYSMDTSTIEWIPDEIITIEMCIQYLSDCVNRDKWVDFDIIPTKILKTEEFLDGVILNGLGDSLVKWNQRRLVWKDSNQEEKLGKRGKPLPRLSLDYLKNHLPKYDSNDNSRLISDGKILLSSQNAFDDPQSNSALVVAERGKLHRLVKKGSMIETSFYYISDIHVEHQMQDIVVDGICQLTDLRKSLSKRFSKMIRVKENYKDILLVAGDVASSPTVEAVFYEELRRKWDGSIVAILGNHELWDGKYEWTGDKSNSRSVEEIVNDYRSRIESYSYSRNVVLLENSIFIRYKNKKDCVISEQDIMESSEEDLEEICHKSTVIILGGVGYSGLNDDFNAENGIYRNTITTRKDDKKRSSRFYAIYSKVLRCAANEKVVVLTHNPVSDWSKEDYNPNWIYVNGHTHRNSIVRDEETGVTVLADNQVGYQPRKWKLNRFTLDGVYNPFVGYADGIYPITSEQFADFNNGRGIVSEGCHYSGQIFVLIKNNYYLFLIESPTSLCLLNGGHRNKLKNVNIDYYYNNMSKYVDNLNSIFKDYYSYLQLVSKEVKAFGGKGTIHGSIVDIDFLNHIYVNPYDGKVTAYFAYDILSRKVYSNLEELIENQVPKLKSRYTKAISNNRLPMLESSIWSNDSIDDISEDEMELMFGTEIYDASRKLRAIQYFFDNNVIRVWEDSILNYVAPKVKRREKKQLKAKPAVEEI